MISAAAAATTAAAARTAAVTSMGVFSFRFFGVSCPRRHAYNSTSRTENVQNVIFNRVFVIFDRRVTGSDRRIQEFP